MMNKFSKFFLIFTSLLISSLFFALPVFAQADEIEVVFGSEPLFDDIENFLPGDSVSNTMTVTNLTNEIRQIGIELIDNSGCQENCLSEQLYLSFKKNGSVVLENSLAGFYKQGEVLLDSLGAGGSVEYDLVVSFEEDAGNRYQNTSANFDLKIGIFGKEAISKEVSSGGTGGGGGSSISIQGLQIDEEAVSEVGATQVTITWVTNKDATSRVIYSSKGMFHSLQVNNPPNYGYVYSTDEFDTPANENGVTSHSIVLENLLPSTTYYYRCVSHASPDTISQEKSFTTASVEESNEKEQQGQEQEIIGEGEEAGGLISSAEPVATGEIAEEEITKGEETDEESEDKLSENREPAQEDEEPTDGKGALANLLAATGGLLDKGNGCWVLSFASVLSVILYILARRKRRKSEQLGKYSKRSWDLYIAMIGLFVLAWTVKCWLVLISVFILAGYIIKIKYFDKQVIRERE